MFQSAPSRGRRRDRWPRHRELDHQMPFQSAPSRGRRRVPGPHHGTRMTSKFQSAPSRGRRRADVTSTSHRAVTRRFNPRLREEGDVHDETNASRRQRCRVSIRAFARKATTPSIGLRVTCHRFQSAPSRGRRRGPRSRTPRRGLSFNPRLREEGDHYLLQNLRLSTNASSVSIRAFARKATSHEHPCRVMTYGPCFNPRLREEGDTPCGSDRRR